MAARDTKHNADATYSHSCEFELSSTLPANGMIQKIQEWCLHRKKARAMKRLTKKLVMVDDVMLIHTDEVI